MVVDIPHAHRDRAMLLINLDARLMPACSWRNTNIKQDCGQGRRVEEMTATSFMFVSQEATKFSVLKKVFFLTFNIFTI